MRRSPFAGGAAVAALLLLTSLARGGTIELEGQVIAVHDGDTVTLVDGARVQRRVRIAGIDAPERSQAFGATAKEGLGRLVQGRRVAARCHKRDRHGRDVCRLFVEARDIGLEQVRSGLAWWYREYAAEQTSAERASYEAAEAEAREASRGLWRNPSPEAPWAWRRQHAPARSAAPT